MALAFLYAAFVFISVPSFGMVMKSMPNSENPSSVSSIVEKNNSGITSSCFKDMDNFRTPIIAAAKTQNLDWRGILNGMLESNKLAPSDFEKIDFSLPGDSGYGDNPEWVFFNPAGKFKAQPVPQELIDRLTTVKNTRLIFNLRRYYDPERDKYTDLPHVPQVQLVVILPNLIPKCSVDGMDAWNNETFTTTELSFAKDNHTIIKDKKNVVGTQVSPDRKNVYFIQPLASRADVKGGLK